MPHRRRLKKRITQATVALLTAGTFGACISERRNPVEPIDDVECVVPARLFGPDRAVVLVRDFAFTPDTLRVRAGTTVAWVSCEPAGREAHTVAATDGAWSSPLLPAAAVYERRFDSPGATSYLCGPHPHMRGTVLVE